MECSQSETFLARSLNHTNQAAPVTFVTKDKNGTKVSVVNRRTLATLLVRTLTGILIITLVTKVINIRTLVT